MTELSLDYSNQAQGADIIFDESAIQSSTLFSSGIVLSFFAHIVVIISAALWLSNNTKPLTITEIPTVVTFELTPYSAVQSTNTTQVQPANAETTNTKRDSLITSSNGTWQLQQAVHSEEIIIEEALPTVTKQDDTPEPLTEVESDKTELPVIDSPPIQEEPKLTDHVQSAPTSEFLEFIEQTAPPLPAPEIEQDTVNLPEPPAFETTTLLDAASQVGEWKNSDSIANEQLSLNYNNQETEHIELRRLDLQSTVGQQATYPVLALKRGIQGDVALNIFFDNDGYIETIDIAQSSGDKTLDKAALKTAKKALKKERDDSLKSQTLTIVISYRLQ